MLSLNLFSHIESCNSTLVFAVSFIIPNTSDLSHNVIELHLLTGAMEYREAILKEFLIRHKLSVITPLDCFSSALPAISKVMRALTKGLTNRFLFKAYAIAQLCLNFQPLLPISKIFQLNSAKVFSGQFDQL